MVLELGSNGFTGQDAAGENEAFEFITGLFDGYFEKNTRLALIELQQRIAAPAMCWGNRETAVVLQQAYDRLRKRVKP